MHFKNPLNDSILQRYWTCTRHNCSKCVGSVCEFFNLTVSKEGAGPTSAPVFDCKYGDTVKLQCTALGFYVNEMVVIEKQGKIKAYLPKNTLLKL